MFGDVELKITGFDYENATELEEMQRNLNMLFMTRAGTCPGDRNFGLAQEFDSSPMNVAQNLFALEVIEKTEIYEPRAEISDITFTQSENGSMSPVVTVRRREANGE